jgi:hypothetical protein
MSRAPQRHDDTDRQERRLHLNVSQLSRIPERLRGLSILATRSLGAYCGQTKRRGPP